MSKNRYKPLPSAWVEVLETHRRWTQSADRISHHGSDFANLDFRYQDLTQARLSYGLFENCDFREAYFSYACLDGTRFVECDLRDAVFTVTNLDHASFVRCDLRGATFAASRLAHVIIEGCRIDKMTSFSDAHLDHLPIRYVDNERYYQMRVLYGNPNGPHILMGCRTFTLNEAWTHWQKYKGGVRDNYLTAIQNVAKEHDHTLRILKRKQS